MSIDRFENAAATGFTGRLTSEKLSNEQAQKPTIFDKIASKIANLFKPDDARSVADRGFDNRMMRRSLERELQNAYPGLPQDFLFSVTEPRDKSLKQSELRQIMRTASELALQGGLTLPGREAPVAISATLVAPSIIAANHDIVPRLQEKIAHGASLVADILSGNPPGGQPSLKDVADVMWYLHLSAEESVGPFLSGAMTVPDPGGRLREFLDSCADVYQRKSSHLSSFQTEPHGTHRGIDFDIGKKTDLDTLLPNGRATVLFGRMPEGTQGLTEERLFVKMESHGCRLGTPSESQRDADGPSDRNVRLGPDLKNSIGHMLSFMQGMEARATGEHAAESRKERVGREFLDGYQNLLDQAASFPGVGAQLTKLLTNNDPMSKTGGIRVMVANMDALRDLSSDDIDFEGAIGIDGTDEQAIEDGIGKFADLMTSALGFRAQIMERYPEATISQRIGNEAVLTLEGLLPT